MATETPTLKVGDPAPAFTLRSHDGRDVSLDGLRGRAVVLAFFAFAFTNT
jgi:peroxiredoxin